MNICDYATVLELHDSIDGKKVAFNQKSLEKYKEVEVIGFHPHLKVDKSERNAMVMAVLYVWGSHSDIQDVKEREKENKQ